MPSDAKKKKAAAKKKQAQAKDNCPSKLGAGASNDLEDGAENGVDTDSPASGMSRNESTASLRQLKELRGLPRNASSEANMAFLAKRIKEVEMAGQEHRNCTGVLTSHCESMDLHMAQLSLSYHGQELLVDTSLELNNGRRYGLIGLNGCGKTTLLNALAARDLAIPEHIDIYHLSREIAPSEMTALDCVVNVDEERTRLETEAEFLALRDDDDSQNRLMDVYDRLDAMDADQAAARAGRILHGLGFTKSMQQREAKSFSGGWRMRIALARALYIAPALLLLDEPTNHLDLDACVWLEEELKQYKRILVIVSHSQDFLNGVTTNTIHFHKKRLKEYGGNFDTYMKTRGELEENQMKQYKWEQDQIAHMKNYIARFGHGSAKLARQAQSKEKTLKKMVDGGLHERVVSDKVLTFNFYECGKLSPPVVMIQDMSFRYNDDTPWIYRNLEFGLDLDTRIALVGPNGAGKSTLIKLIAGELVCTEGLIRRHNHLRIARYHQHLSEQLDVNKSAIEWMMARFPNIKDIDDMRKIVGRYGLSGQQQMQPMKNLSDGQRCRVLFAWLAQSTPHMLLLDEPTNHLDIETIDSLADAILSFDGGMVVVSHDFRLISQVAEEVYVCENETITKWEGDIFSYKQHLANRVKKADAKLKGDAGSKVVKKATTKSKEVSSGGGITVAFRAK